MSSLERKELRLLMPSFPLGVLTALSVWLVPGPSTDGTSFWQLMRFILPFAVCPVMVVTLALDSLGREMSSGTFAQLLSQPIPRIRLWLTKICLVGGAMLLIWAIWLVSLLLHKDFGGNALTGPDLTGVVIASLLYVLVILSGGLWTVLLFRQVGVAFWITVLLPALIYFVAIASLEDRKYEHIGTVVTIIFSLYSIGGFLFAHYLFLRAQDVQWAGGVIRMPRWQRSGVRRTAPRSVRKYRPRLAILGREFRLHKSYFVIALLLAAVHLASVAARNMASDLLHGHDVIDGFVHVVWIFWFLMPLIVGCGAVAEERRLGTLEGQLCLPARPRAHFVAKIAVTALSSVLFGSVMPSLLEGLDGSKIAFVDLVSQSVPGKTHPLLIWYGLMSPAVALLTGLVAFYFSSLKRNTLQAIGPAVVGCFVAGYLFNLSYFPENKTTHPLWHGLIGDVVGFPIMIFLVLWLAFRNYRTIFIDHRVWLRNLLTLAGGLICSAAFATGLYHRAWEFLLPLEAQHGPAKLAVSSRTKLESSVHTLAVHLPDGRYWLGNFGYSKPGFGTYLMSNWRLTELSGASGFLEKSNWMSVGICAFDLVGIQRDGSLWTQGKPPRFEFGFYDHPRISRIAALPLTKIGDSHDWKEVVALGKFAVVLKNDGTLWAWKTNDVWRTRWPGLSALKLQRLGDDSDWAEIRRVSESKFYFRKKDGRIWSNVYGGDTNGEIALMGDWNLQRRPYLDGHDWKGLAQAGSSDAPFTVPGETSLVNGMILGLRDDGSLRVVALLPNENDSRGITWPRDIPLDAATNWVSIVNFGAESFCDIAALKSDGSLWKWTFPLRVERIGTHSDWVAISSDEINLLSLSADGTIWFWKRDEWWSGPGKGFPVSPLIGVSRRPQFVANIFSGE